MNDQHARPNNGFMKSFLPGMIVGLVVGVFGGVFISPYLTSGPSFSTSKGPLPGPDGTRPREGDPINEAMPEASELAPADATNLATDPALASPDPKADPKADLKTIPVKPVDLKLNPPLAPGTPAPKSAPN